MMSSFSLQPDNGVLKAPGLALNMQVEMRPYRLDFLANGWLVIEIDGNVWHSSPEAVARDKARDEFFHSYNYTVLRIPAKVVFSTPQEAVRRVRASLAEGRKISIKPEAPKIMPTGTVPDCESAPRSPKGRPIFW
jgi:very-short-patch-repair endonuclease